MLKCSLGMTAAQAVLMLYWSAVQAEYEEQTLQTDTVWWAAPTSVLVSSTAYEGEVCFQPV